MQDDDLVVQYLVHETLAAVGEHHQGVHHAGLQAPYLDQKFIDGDNFADRIAGRYQAVKVFVAAVHVAASALAANLFSNNWRCRMKVCLSEKSKTLLLPYTR